MKSKEEIRGQEQKKRGQENRENEEKQKTRKYVKITNTLRQKLKFWSKNWEHGGGVVLASERTNHKILVSC